VARNRSQRARTGEPYVRVHKGYWHLYYRNPDPRKNYPTHKSLELLEEQRAKAETIEAEARLLWKQCEGAFEVEPSKIEQVFARFVADKIEGRKSRTAQEAKSEYLDKTLGDVLEEFLTSKQGKAKRTRQHYRSHVEQIRRSMDCGRPACDFKPEDVQQYLQARMEKEGIHKRTANKELGTLRSVFYFAQRRGYVEKNPARMVESLSLEAEDKEELEKPVHIPGDCYEALLRSHAARTHPPVRALMFLLYHTGMRIGELLRLRWRDIDLERNVMHVTASPQKGGDRDPYMVSRQLRLYLKLARKEAEDAFASGKWKTQAPSDRIAVIPNGHGLPWSYTNLANRVWWPFLQSFQQENPDVYARLQQAAGTSDPDKRPISFHDFRHTFITDLLVKGINPIVVGWLVGHKELHTQRRYTHLCYQHFREEFEGFKR